MKKDVPLERYWLVPAVVLVFTLSVLTLQCDTNSDSPSLETVCVSGESCDDGDPCTLDDRCTQQGNCLGTAVDCDDGRPCTKDYCGENGVCTNELLPGYCLIDGSCFEEGQIAADNPCKECLTAANTASWSNDNTNPCHLDDLCIETAVCLGGECVSDGLPKDCDDANPCTEDYCDPGTGDCVHQPAEGVCNIDGLCLDGECRPACANTPCPELPGYNVTCNSAEHCEYQNQDPTGWRIWDVWLYLPPGTFPMGSEEDEIGHEANETPVHIVDIRYGFFISKYEIVAEQYHQCLLEAPEICTTPSVADWDGNGWGVNGPESGRLYHPQNGLVWQQARSRRCFGWDVRIHAFEIARFRQQRDPHRS